MIDFIELSKDHSMVEIVATKKIDGRSLAELNIRGQIMDVPLWVFSEMIPSFVISPQLMR